MKNENNEEANTEYGIFLDYLEDKDIRVEDARLLLNFNFSNFFFSDNISFELSSINFGIGNHYLGVELLENENGVIIDFKESYGHVIKNPSCGSPVFILYFDERRGDYHHAN